jgi:TonB family protein
MRKFGKLSSSYTWQLIIVLLIHASLLALKISTDLTDTISQVSTEQPQKPKPIKIKVLRNYQFTGKQIVESEDGNSEAHPMDDAYLSDKTRKFDRETQSKNIGVFKKGARGEVKGSDAKNIELSELSTFKKGHDPYKSSAKAYSQKLKGEVNGHKGERGESASGDHLLNIPPGDFTYLNTIEYKYYGFYHRIRQKLEQFWGRSIQEKAALMVKKGRSIASDDEHITALVIILSAEGEIERIVIKGSSGVQELDDAAIEAFNEAGPFPNPPRGLIVNGQVQIEWGFVVKT